MKTSELTRIALMTAVLCILAPISIPAPFSTVAFSFATFAIYLMVYMLKPRLTLTAVVLYLLLGAAGLPVFSGYMAGISRFAAPSGGYLIGYLFLAGISSLCIHRSARISVQMAGMFLGTLIMYGIGTFWLAASSGISFFAALPAGMLIFLPPDIIKIILAVYLGRKIQTHIK